jgi:hypothetical protein
MSSKGKKEITDIAEIVKCHSDGISIEGLLYSMNRATPKELCNIDCLFLLKLES